MRVALRYAIDFGSSSIGWAIFKIENGQPCGLVDLGSRIFDDGRDPQTKESNAKARREPRAMRRSYDRRAQRYRHVMEVLVKLEMMPSDPEERKAMIPMSPYDIRAKALREAMPMHYLGRAFWHINKHRGFKSNRKTDTPDENGKITSAAERLSQKMNAMGCETYGAFLAARQADPDVRNRKPTRIRQNSQNKDELYEFYPTRDMLISEFDLICQRQRSFNPGFPDEAQIAHLRDAIFWQRPLKPVEPGFCSFFPEEIRLMKAHPLAEEFIIYQKVNELRIYDDEGYTLPLSIEMRDRIVEQLLSGKDVSWVQLRRIVGLRKASGRISLEEGGEKKLEGSSMAYRFKGNKKPGPFADNWGEIRQDQQKIDTLLAAYRTSNTDSELRDALAPLNLEGAQSELALKCRLPDGHLMISKRAVEMILPHLKSEIMTYAEACKRAGLHHSDRRDGEVFDILPYYNEIDSMKRFLGHGTGHKDDPRDVRYGRIANPTVHIGLNQLRRLINSMIAQYGRPDEIVLELSREIKKNKAQKNRAKRENDQNRKANDSRRREMEKIGFYEKGDRIRTREALERIRLWEELGRNPNDRVCPYSGKPIQSLSKLLSDEIEIEHILPRSISLDDSPANKTIAYREWNRLKRNLTPAEAAQRFPDKFNQDEMIYRSRNMPLNKKWRFGTDARERLGQEEKWQDRLLKETQHFGVVAGHYLKKLAPADVNRKEISVWVTSGRLTSELRRKWGLHTGTNQKNRNDHRHHALDAAVIGVTDRSLINRLSRAAAQDEEQAFGRVLASVPEPFKGFTDQVNAAVKKVIVSHRANHRIAGKLHLDGAYGKVRENPKNIERGEPARGNLVIRRDILSLNPNMIEQVRDEKIRQTLQQVLHEAKEIGGADKKAFEKALAAGLAEYARRTGTRRVRCLYPKENAIPVGKDRQGNRYKYVVPAENHHVDIVELGDGGWQAVWVDIFEANQAALAERKGHPHRPKWQAEHPDAKFIMRLHKGDTLQLLDEDGVNRVKVVVSLRASLNTVQLAEHLEAGILQKRHDDPEDPFRWDFANIGKLKARRARRVRIDETGRIRTVEHGRI